MFLHNLYFVFPWKIQILLNVSDITGDMYYKWGFIWFSSVSPRSWLFYKNCCFLT